MIILNKKLQNALQELTVDLDRCRTDALLWQDKNTPCKACSLEQVYVCGSAEFVCITFDNWASSGAIQGRKRTVKGITDTPFDN